MMRAMLKMRSSHAVALRVSALALATAMAAQPAFAQSVPSSYNAPQPTVASGSVTPNYNTGGTDIYTVNSATAVLDFTPSDNATNPGAVIDFQNAGTQAVYRSALGGPDFTVLNRIVPADVSRPIAFNGNVVSQLRDATGTVTRGGSVWFYSPGGIVIGDGSVFDIGSLLLTTADPTGGSGAIGSTTSFTLNSTPGAGGIVNVLSDATINATQANSYVALVAPIVFSRGRINVNGGAAFVAAESASLTFNQGLFDIAINVGSDDAGGFPLQLRGTVSLDKSNGAATNQRGIYAVAYPKNDAITMVVAPDGFYGFDIANGATIQNGAVYLQAGGNLTVNPALPTRGQIQALPQAAGANISIEGSSDPAQLNGGRFTAPVAARATDTITVSNQANGLSFARDASFFGGISASLESVGGRTIAVGGDLDVFSLGLNDPGTATLSASGGGVVNVTGAISVIAAVPTGITFSSLYDTSTGGTAAINVTAGGQISAGSIGVNASGFGNAGQVAQGGNASINIANGGITTPGSVVLSTVANGTDSATTGGTTSLSVANGQFSIGQTLSANAIGNGGAALNGAAGTGGMVTLNVGAGGVLTATQASLDASGKGGNAAGANGSGGLGTGGAVQFTIQPTVNTPTSTTFGDLMVRADGTGGNGQTGPTSAGGAGVAGTGVVSVGAGSRLTVDTASIFIASTGGNSAGGGTGGLASGGSASFSNAGIADFGLLSVNMVATGGNKTGGIGDAGAAQAGTALLQSINAGVLTATRPVPSPIVGGVSVLSSATGGSVTGGVGSGGAATAADARVVTTGGAAITTAAAFAGSNAAGGAALGAGSSGGSATASTTSISQGSSASVAVNGNATLRANATGGASPGGAGGGATAGDVRLVSNDGTVSVAGAATLSAIATGGAGTVGGAATGGLTNIGANTSQTSVTGAVSLSSAALGGDGSAGSGGAATGGNALIGTVGVGTITLGNSVSSLVSATGGTGIGANASGGLGQGGIAQIFAVRGAVNVTGAVLLDAHAIGGTKSTAGTGATGNATGGRAEIFANAGNVTLANDARFDTSAFVRVSLANAGNAVGGNALISSFINQSNGAGGGGTVSIAGSSSFDAGALAGEANGPTGNGGMATGGTIRVLADRGALTLGDISASSGATGFAGDNPATNMMRGGTIAIEARNADLTINGSVSASASANGAFLINALPARTAGDALGGTISITAGSFRQLNITGSVQLSATAVGGRTNAGVGAVAGQASGGTITVDALGTISIGGGLDTEASGFGGNSFAFDGATGGKGRGGVVDIAALGGDLQVTTEIIANADGRGGNAETFRAGNGGEGEGGLARISAVQNGNVQVGGPIVLTSDGQGGNAGSTGGVGGRGLGGASDIPLGVFLVASDAGSITGGSAILHANGTGGTSFGTANGPNGTGGVVVVRAENATIDLSGSDTLTTIEAVGTGGEAFTAFDSNDAIIAGGGTGGLGVGGAVIVNALYSPDNANAPGLLRFGDVSFSAAGIGGRGAEGVAGADGGAGGVGNAGNAEIVAGAGNGILTAGMVTVDVSGTGGAGGRGGAESGNGLTGTGGVGGVGQGGTGTIGTISGEPSTITEGSATFGDLFINSGGLGGTGGGAPDRAGAGGGGVGGAYVLQSSGAQVTTAMVTMTATGVGGDGGTGDSDAVGGVGGGQGGSASLIVANRDERDERGSLTQAGAFVIDTAGRIGAGTGGAVTVAGSAKISLINSDATVGTLLASTDGGNASSTVTSVSVDNGTLTADALGLQTVGDIGLYTINGGRMRIGDGALQATGTILFGNGVAPSNVPGDIAFSGDLSAIVGGNYSVGGPLQVGGNYAVAADGSIDTLAIAGGTGISFAANGAVSLGNVSSGGTIRLASRTGSIIADAITAGRSFVALAGNNVTTGGIATGRTSSDTAFISNIGLIQSGPAANMLGATGTFNSQFDYAALATMVPQRLAGTLTINGPISTGNLVVAAAGGVAATGALDATTLISIDSGTTITLGDVITPARLMLQADGTISTRAISAQDVSLTSNLGAITTGAITSASNVALLGRVGRVTVGAISAASNIGISGRDVSLNGAVVAPTINLIALGDATIGGTGEGAGYTLDGSEFARLRGGAINVSTAGGLILRDLSLLGSAATQGTANITSTQGALTFNAATIRVTGSVRLNSAAAANSLVFNATDSFRLVNDAGSLGIFGSGDALAGRLAITARSIEAGTSQLLSLGGSTGFEGALSRSTITAIGAPAAQPRPEGYLQAGRIELSAADDIVIQNSGSSTLAAGFSAGSGGLRIASSGTAGRLNTIVYGRVQGASDFLTNADTRGSVSFVSQSDSAQSGTLTGFSSISTVNGCAVDLAIACSAPSTDIDADVQIAPNVRDLREGEFLTFALEALAFPTQTPAVIDMSALNADAIITDPVASSGNTSLWDSSYAGTVQGAGGPGTGRKDEEEDPKKRRGRREIKP